MKREVWRGQNSARFLYYRYKDSSYFPLGLIVITLFICFLLIFNIVIPQAQKWFSVRDEVTAIRQNVAVLRGNAAFMLELNKDTLESNRQLAIRALPVEKDFGEIIDAIVVSAARSGVSIEDFSFSLGRVSSASAKPAKNFEESDSATNMTLFFSGDRGKIKSFINEISEKLPISEIKSIEEDGDRAYISLFFYSKPYEAPRVSEDDPIRPLSSENNSVFSKLSNWEALSPKKGQDTSIPSSEVPLF